MFILSSLETNGKRVVDFLFVIIESLDTMAEALRAKIGQKSAISLQRGQFGLKYLKFQVEGDFPHQ